MKSIQYIVKLARIGDNWTTLSDVRKWRWVSDIAEQGSEITEFEYAQTRGEAKLFSRLTAQDVAKATKGTQFFAVIEQVTTTTAAAEPEIVELDEECAIIPLGSKRAALLGRVLPQGPKMKDDSEFVRVSLAGRRPLYLASAVISKTGTRVTRITGFRMDRKGHTLESTRMAITLNAKSKVTALGTNCKGELVPLSDACKCGTTQALAVEHGRNWGGR